MKDVSGARDRIELKADLLFEAPRHPSGAGHVGVSSVKLLKASSSYHMTFYPSLPQDQCLGMRIKYFSLSHEALGASDACLDIYHSYKHERAELCSVPSESQVTDLFKEVWWENLRTGLSMLHI